MSRVTVWKVHFRNAIQLTLADGAAAKSDGQLFETSHGGLTALDVELNKQPGPLYDIKTVEWLGTAAHTGCDGAQPLHESTGGGR